MPTIQAHDLQRITETILTAANVPNDEAATVATLLVASDLAGHGSHGVLRLPQYLDAIEQGLIVPGAPLEVVSETCTVAVLDANWGFGQVAAMRASQMAADKAETCSLGAVAVRRSNHVGRLADYVEMVAARQMVGMMFVNGHGGAHNTVPYGGADARLCTNPLGCALPTGGDPLVLDISTSAVAEGKIRTYRISGSTVPEGWIVDSEGRPTTDPGVLYRDPPGSLLPLGGNVGHKGFALSLMVDLLAGALSGAGCSGPDVDRGGNAFTIFALDLRAFCGPEQFTACADALVVWVQSSRPSLGFDRIIVPGELEAAAATCRCREGIPLPEETWSNIKQAAYRVGAEVSL